MVVQKAVEFTEYFRCFVVGQKKVRIMPYDPRRPHAERYLQGAARAGTLRAKLLYRRMEEDALKLCRALGYDLNSVEFAVENGIPYAIDFMNPVPDADVHSVGETNFQWIVDQTADFLIARANTSSRSQAIRWPALLDATDKVRSRSVKARSKPQHGQERK
jgi:hypothetical protein